MSRRTEALERLEEATENDGAVQTDQESKSGLGDDHPLNDIIGTHEGPIWERVLKNIKRNRKRADKEYLEQLEA